MGSRCVRVELVIPSFWMAASSEGQRSPGFLATMRSMVCTTSGGQSGRKSFSGGSSSWQCLYMTVTALSPSKGSLPVSIWKATTPREY